VRKVLAATVVLIVLVWLIPWDLQPDGQIQVPPLVAPIVTSPAISPTEQADSGRRHVAPASTPYIAERPAPKPRAPATTKAMPLRMWGERGLDGPVSSLFQQSENAFVAEPLDPLWSRTRACRRRTRGMPDAVYQDLLARLGYTQMIPMGTAGDARTITSLTYLPRQDVEGP